MPRTLIQSPQECFSVAIELNQRAIECSTAGEHIIHKLTDEWVHYFVERHDTNKLLKYFSWINSWY